MLSVSIEKYEKHFTNFNLLVLFGGKLPCVCSNCGTTSD